MNLIITMASKYIRFKKAGFTTPKFLLPFKNARTIFEEIMREIIVNYSFENIVFIANNEDIEYKESIEKAIKASGIEADQLIFIEDTKGQAETALLGVHELEKRQCRSKKILIHNIDTVLYNRDMESIDAALNNNSGYIEVFEASKTRYSYVKTESNDIVTEIKEKVVISNKATTGLYAFSDMDEYTRYYKQLETSEEYYISYLYDLMLGDKKRIAINSTMEKTVILGTPEEYEKYKDLL